MLPLVEFPQIVQHYALDLLHNNSVDSFSRDIPAISV